MPITPVGRIALREEGVFWNAYYARPVTMIGAIFLGSISLSLVGRSPLLKREFMDLMRNAASDHVKFHNGDELVWGPPEEGVDQEGYGRA